MFIANHYATTFIVGQALGMTPAECAIGASGAAVNDVVPTVAYWLDNKLGKWGKVYDFMHNFSWWMMAFPVLILILSAYNINTNIAFLAFVGYVAHIAIDKLWHKQEGGYEWWGVRADVAVGIVCVVYFILWRIL